MILIMFLIYKKQLQITLCRSVTLDYDCRNGDIMSFGQRLNRIYATGLGIGELNIIPGTLGSLLAVIIYLLIPGITSNPLFIILIFVIGVLSCNMEEKRTLLKDDPRIVIDEMAGMWLTLILRPDLLLSQVVIGFLLFRFFDILKPGLIDGSQELSGGLGVMVDDLLAGLVSAGLLQLIMVVIY